MMAPEGTEATKPSEPLQHFVRARIGGEPLHDTGDGTLVTDTGVQALAVAGALLDSPTTGGGKGRLFTRLLRGAVLVLYALVHLLGGSGVRRGLGLALLALGGALIGLDLVTPDTPQPITAAGFGILLGGLAYAALTARMYVHALLLATPAVPLVVYAQTATTEDDTNGRLLVVLGLMLTLLLIGTVQTHLSTPWRALLAALPWLAGTAVVTVVGWVVVSVVGKSLDRLTWALVCCGVLGGLAWMAAGLRASRTWPDGELAWSFLPRQRYLSSVWAWSFGLGYALLALVLAALAPLFDGDRSLVGWEPQTPGWLASDTADDWTGAVSWSLVALAVLCQVLAVVAAVPRRSDVRARTSSWLLVDGARTLRVGPLTRVPAGAVASWPDVAPAAHSLSLGVTEGPVAVRADVARAELQPADPRRWVLVRTVRVTGPVALRRAGHDDLLVTWAGAPCWVRLHHRAGVTGTVRSVYLQVWPVGRPRSSTRHQT